GYLAIGVLMSAMTQSQLVAIVLSSLVILGLFMIGIGEFIFDAGALHDFCAYVSVWGQMGEVSEGVVDARALVLDATFIVLPLVAAGAGRGGRGGGLNRGRPAQWSAGAGAPPALALAVLVNVYAARHSRRWDLTTHGLYTLSPATVDTLHALAERVEVDVLLS